MNTGIVFKKSTGSYSVNVNGQMVMCAISSKLRKVLIMPTADRSSVPHQKVQEVRDIEAVDPVAVGDVVSFIDNGDNTGLIMEVHERKNALTRRAPGPKPLEQVIVANVDQVLVVFAAAQPRPKWNLLDRYLVSAEACEVPAIICITKIDLVRGRRDEAEVIEEVENYRSMGYTVLISSASKGVGVYEFEQAITGRTSALVGMSGVGKSSLLNAVQPGLGIRVNEINTNLDKGRHTTTHLEMFALERGGAVVDTPGMKQFGLWNVEPEEVALLFAEMRPFVGTCKFGLKCTHTNEPGCGIVQAVLSGEISARRHQSYVYMRDHLEAEY
jgi:ribosome biogenesis GTPase / thiamine phosphate phosphatase